MPDGWEIALYIHLLGVIAMASTGGVLLTCLTMMRRARVGRELVPWTLVASTAERGFLVAAAVLVVSGGYMVQDRDLVSWSDGWIITSAITLLVAALAGPHVMSAKLDAIHDSAEAAGDESISKLVKAQVVDPMLHGTAHTFVLVILAIVWNMMRIPGSGEAIAAIAGAVAVGAASSAPAIVRHRQVLSEANS